METTITTKCAASYKQARSEEKKKKKKEGREVS
jgi:hypothetical protein